MKTWKRIPTYDECVEMCKIHGDMVFYMTKKNILGYDVHIFSYRYAQPNDFINPIEGNDVTAHDLRGLTFVFNKDGSLYKRFVGLPKFWNINQCSEALYEDFKDTPIESVYDKRDGSMVSFIDLPNGKIVPKTKGSIYPDPNGYVFFNEINSMVFGQVHKYNPKNQNIERINGEYERFITDCLSKDISPIFEYTSFDNKIVLRYDEVGLHLLRLRSNITGEFFDIKEYSKGYDIKLAQEITNFNSLKEIMLDAETAEDKEGYVIRFADKNGTLLKQKTAWYFDRHHLTTDAITRSNKIACMILDETIDDVISLLDPIQDKQRLDYVDYIQEKLVTFMDNDYKVTLEKYMEIFVTKFKCVPKEFANGYGKKDKYFGYIMGLYNGKDLTDMIRDAVRKDAYYLAKMENFLETGDFNL